MQTSHRFGGDWTEAKLQILNKYLHAYTVALSKQSWCQKIYVDAFAGTGYREEKNKLVEEIPELGDAATADFLKGSAVIALETIPSFDKYLFIERKAKFAVELEKLKLRYINAPYGIDIKNTEANQYLCDWCQATNWKDTRAVVFLDPYGMQVEWKTLEVLAKTNAVDLWLLFPVGQAVNRVLTTRELPPPSWAKTLTRTFGTEAWLEEFYPVSTVPNLFGEFEQTKSTNFERISNFFIRRLETVFPFVAQNPMLLNNSQGIPLYMLCFASANKGNGGQIAVKIAQDILRS